MTATSSNPPGFTVSAEIISVCVIDFIGRKGGFVVGVDNGCVPSVVTRWSVPSQRSRIWLICLSLISTVSLEDLEAENHRKSKGTNFGWGVSRAIIVVSSNKFCAMRSCSVCWMALNKCLKLTECNYIFMLLSICSTVTSHVLCPRCLDILFQNVQTMYSRFIQNAYTTSPLCLCTALALIEASLCRAAFFWPSQELFQDLYFYRCWLRGHGCPFITGWLINKGCIPNKPTKGEWW